MEMILHRALVSANYIVNILLRFQDVLYGYESYEMQVLMSWYK